MTIAVDLGRKATKPTNKQNYRESGSVGGVYCKTGDRRVAGSRLWSHCEVSLSKAGTLSLLVM